ncbi:MAG: hypothetical protein GF308_09785 [Candidatus Heimdallarchaeota archaeon]|nr:hypothetical protein [Candidatus Heimdallarchaeota archaeon]
MKEKTFKITEQILAGTSLMNWLRLLWENRFQIDWQYIPRALFITLIGTVSRC